MGDTRRGMRGRYNGCIMGVYGSVLPGARSLAKLSGELSKAARLRLKWFDYYHSHGGNARLTCRHFDSRPRRPFYRWKRRYDPRNLSKTRLWREDLRGPASPPQEAAATNLEPGAGPSGAIPAGAIPSLGKELALSLPKGQAGGAAEAGGLAGIHLDGGTHSRSSKEAWGASGTP